MGMNTYYQVYRVGDTYSVIAVTQSETVFEKDGKYYIKETLEDMYGDDYEGDLRVFPTKQEAWKKILQMMDDTISNLHKLRQETLDRAINDSGLVDKEQAAKWIKNIKESQ
jgi:hypothetical protein